MLVLSVDSLPLGFRFRPTDEELLNHYLRLKNKGEKWDVEPIREVALNNFEPWDLPDLSIIGSDDQGWFFFNPRLKKYPRSDRSNRATNAGYWKPTGQDRTVRSRSSGMKKIGNKKTLVFYQGRAPKGVKTSWIIHEYSTNSEKCAFVLCRLFNQDVKFENSNSVEVELTGYSPTATRSPEVMPSNEPVVQSTLESDMQVEEQPAIIERCPNDKSDFNAVVPIENHVNTFVVSDVEDYEAEGDTLSDEYLIWFDEPTNEMIDYSICDEGELTGPNPAVAGSSPVGLQSDQPVVQSTSASDMMKTGEQADKTDHISFDALAPKEGHHTTYMASDMQDRKAELGTTEGDPQLEEWWPTDWKSEYSNCDEIELSGFTLTSTGSAPERMSSSLPIIQSTAESYMQVGDLTASIERGIQSLQHTATCTEAMPNKTMDLRGSRDEFRNNLAGLSGILPAVSDQRGYVRFLRPNKCTYPL